METTATPSYHQGPVQIRWDKRHVTVLCPLGHLVTRRAFGEGLAGSALAAKISSHQAGTPLWTVRCQGSVQP